MTVLMHLHILAQSQLNALPSNPAHCLLLVSLILASLQLLFGTHSPTTLWLL